MFVELMTLEQLDAVIEAYAFETRVTIACVPPRIAEDPYSRGYEAARLSLIELLATQAARIANVRERKGNEESERRNSFGTYGGCELHNRVGCVRCSE